MRISVPFAGFPLSLNTCPGITEVWSSGSLLCEFKPLSSGNFLTRILPASSSPTQLPSPLLLYKTASLSHPYLISWTYFCTFKALLTGDHITYDSNYEACESERGPNSNFAGITDACQESPQQTKAHGHHAFPLTQRALCVGMCCSAPWKRWQRLGNGRVPFAHFPPLTSSCKWREL